MSIVLWVPAAPARGRVPPPRSDGPGSPAGHRGADATLPRWFQLFLGIAEVLAAVGLTLPGLTRIAPFFVTWAAVGVMIVTASATVFHLSRSEWSSAVITLILLAMAAFVAYGRYRLLPIRAHAAA